MKQILTIGLLIGLNQTCMASTSKPEKSRPPQLSPKEEAMKIFDLYQEKLKEMKSCSFIQKIQERLGHKMGPIRKLFVKYRKPGEIYLKILEGPRKDTEILYKPGWNHEKAKVHLGSFPYFTLNLDPQGSLMMEDQHHPIHHITFDYLNEMIENSIRDCGSIPGTQVELTSLLSENALKTSFASSYRIEFKVPWIEKQEIVQKNEKNLWNFSKRIKRDPYSILHANNLKNFDSISEGTLQIPICYAQKTILHLNQENFLPSLLEAYDGKGQLYEAYEWEKINHNAPLADIDFDPKNPDYHF